MKMIYLKTIMIVSILTTLVLISCSKTNDEILPKEPVQINLTQEQAAIIESGNSFAFDIFRKILENTPETENIIISPLSISYALSMTLNGANGATREAMLSALGSEGITPEQINASFSELTEALLSVDKRINISLANSVWTEKKFSVKKSFIDILQDYYKAESQQFDINDETAPGRINAWIEDNTNGLIKNMIDRLNDNTVMLIINAVYFKGKWKSQFAADKTSQKLFYKPGTSASEVPMMKQTSDFKIYDGTGFVMAEFPYGQGNFVMDVILPDAIDGVAGLLPVITDTEFTNWIENLSEHEVNLLLPRFKNGFKKQLKDILTDMGMGIAFNDGADFTNIADTPPLIINDVTHQAYIETNEEGTEAAAATIVDIGTTSVGPEPLNFNADHPFLYLIRETTTNSIIFMGKVADPLAE